MREKVKAVLRGNEQYKEEFLAKMDWVEKTKTRHVAHTDITVSIQVKKRGATKDSHKVACFTFRNGVAELLTTTNYIQVCVHKNRLFIREADNVSGYKITSPTTSVSKYCKMPALDVFDEFVGDFELKYDDFLELYYIEKEASNVE